MAKTNTESADGLFPSGFLVDVKLTCHEELQLVAVFWQLEALQIQSGHYRGRIRGLHTARTQLAIANLCSAVRASRRTLHTGFPEVFGIPPMRYLQILRLNAARREILSRRSSGLTLTRIAGDCGFSHLGRFSSAYKRFYGALPSGPAISEESKPL